MNNSLFIFSPGKENLPPIITTPRHSIDSSIDQTLPGKKICKYLFEILSLKKINLQYR